MGKLPLSHHSRSPLQTTVTLSICSVSKYPDDLRSHFARGTSVTGYDPDVLSFVGQGLCKLRESSRPISIVRFKYTKTACYNNISKENISDYKAWTFKA